MVAVPLSAALDGDVDVLSRAAALKLNPEVRCGKTC
jgi:hypothetical protein